MARARGDQCEYVAAAAWTMVTDRTRTLEEAQRALERIQWAKSVSLPNAQYDLVEAAALYRVGRVDESRAILKRLGNFEVSLPGERVALLALRLLVGEVSTEPERDLEALLDHVGEQEPELGTPGELLLRELEER